jgi:hypothetical protein
MQRRDFLSKAAAAGGAVGAGAIAWGVSAEGQGAALRVPMDVEIRPSWLTWVTAATGCLRALGVDCDNVEVAGHSGYAFHMCILPEVSVAGPTVFPWEDLSGGVRGLGRSTLEYQSGNWSDDDLGPHLKEAFELAKREIEAGRPSLLWGTGLPEFGVVVGIEGDEYIYKWSGDPGNELRVRYDGLSCPGGVYLLTFPTPTRTDPVSAGRLALANALDWLNRRAAHPDHHYGLAGYDAWIRELRAQRANEFGNSYCAQCYSNAKQYCRDFVARLAERNEGAAGPLDQALIAYTDVGEAMERIAQLFPFPGGEEEKIEDLTTIDDAVDALQAASEAELRAAAAIEGALRGDWPEA